MSKKNILVIGSGAREHAIVLGLKRSGKSGLIYALPGNAGINEDAIGVNISQADFAAIAGFCEEKSIDFVIVGPEQPLVDGIVDFLESKKIKVFGPNKVASQIEGSKDFMKEISVRYGIPTAAYETFENQQDAIKYVKSKGAPIVVKTDGLAAGKGVTVAFSVEEAVQAIKEAFGGKFGSAGSKLVIEDFLEGEEASFFAILDGETALEIGSAQDHKAVFDGDKGPNTGGMGTYSPAPIVDSDVARKIMERIIKPTIEGLKKDGIKYKGFLFAGLMIDSSGDPKLIEYNIRFGDPEAQVLIPRIDNDLVELIEASINGKLKDFGSVKLSALNSLCVVMAAKGYPGEYQKNLPIDLSAVKNLDNTVVYHAGTTLKDGKLVSSGGRVLGVTGFGESLQQAYDNAYDAVSKIKFEGGFNRTDIGLKGLKRYKQAS